MTALAASPILAPERPRRSAHFWRLVGLSVALHIALIGLLIWFSTQDHEAPPPPPKTMDVTIADDVGLKAAAPQNLTPPAQSRAPVIDKPQEAAAAPPAETQPEPSPPKPQPEAAPPPKPAPVAKPQPKKVAPPAPQKVAKAQAKPAPAAPAKPVKTPGKATSTASNSTKTRASGASLGDIMKGISPEKSTSTSVAPKAAVMSQQALMDIVSAIQRQIQPCADRQSKSGLGLGSEKIKVTFHLLIGRDGRLSAQPQIVRTTGVNDDNKLYAGRVGEIGLNALRQCSPLRLPPEYYSTPAGGWNSINYTWFLRG